MSHPFLRHILILLAAAVGLGSCGGDPGKPDGGAGDAAAGPAQWYFTCGDPVCRGYTPRGVAACTTERTGDPCALVGQQCDPMDSCNRLLRCATSDPTSVGCPKSSRERKRDITYLDEQKLEQVAKELLGTRLATYQYKSGGPTRLGFIIEDQGLSMSVDPERDMVDLYGYTSMAVAALKVQQRQIAALQQQVGELSQKLAAARRGRR